MDDYKDDTKKKDVKLVSYPGKKVLDLLCCDGDKNIGVEGVNKAMCILYEDGGSGVSGKVMFEDIGGKTRITAEINGLKPGKHGFHIHLLGDLSGGCKTALGHFNPFNKNHGGPNDEERHVGDLGNIIANNKEKTATIDIIDELVQLNGINSIIGRSVVVHEGEDDLGKGGYDDSLTTGHAGGRRACGVIGIGN